MALSKSTWYKAVFVYLGYLAYHILFWVSFGRVFKSTGEYTDVKVILPAVLVTILLAVAQVLQLRSIYVENGWIHAIITHAKGYIHLPMLTFIVCSIATYGVILHKSYLAAAMKSASASPSSKFNQTMMNSTVTPIQEQKCFDSRLDNFEFYVLQSVLPMLVFSQMIFPFPSGSYTFGQKCALGLKLVESFDMMDLLSDTGCVQQGSVGLQVVFYISMFMAAILLAVPAGLEDLVHVVDGKFDQDEEHGFDCFRTFKSICMLIFVDILFFIIRIILMSTEGSNQHGYGFVWKEFFTAGFRLMFIFKAFTGR